MADNEWFFDTELLVVAERAGLRISEVPVDWSDDPNTSVHIANTARKDLLGVWRMLWSSHRDLDPARTIRPPHLPAALGELMRTARLGATGATVYLVLLLVLTQFITISVANLVALALGVGVRTACSSRSAGRHVTGANRWARAAGAGLVFTTSAVATTVVIGITGLWAASPDIAALAAATVGLSVGAVTRFVLCRSLVFRAYLGHAYRPDPGAVAGSASNAHDSSTTPTLHAVLIPSQDADLLARR